MKKILVVGAREDPHVRFLADALRETGEVIHFDYTEFPIIEIRDDDDISINSEIIESKNSVILWRENLTYHKIDNIDFFDRTEKDFFTTQWNDVINFISFRVPVQNQIKHRGRASAAGSKILSRRFARSAGIAVPKQIITNNYASIAIFVEEQESVYKTLGTYLPPKNIPTYTMTITQDFIENNREHINYTPNLIPEKIVRRYEKRVLLIGDDVFVSDIDVNAFTDDVDWRRVQENKNMFQPGSIDNSTKIKLIEFCKGMNLHTVSFDFIVDKYEEPIFIECNPFGQFLFVEHFDRSDLIASFVKVIQRIP